MRQKETKLRNSLYYHPFCGMESGRSPLNNPFASTISSLMGFANSWIAWHMHQTTLPDVASYSCSILQLFEKFFLLHNSTRLII